MIRHWWNIIKQLWIRRSQDDVQLASVLMPRLQALLPNDSMRYATFADIDSLVELEKVCYANYVAWDASMMYRDMRHNPYAVYVVVECEGMMIAAIIGRIHYKNAHISHLMVHPCYQSQGYGTALLDLWRQFALRCCSQSMTLEVGEQNEVAIRLYEAQGFERVEKLPSYYPDGTNAWRMRALLKGVSTR